MIEGHLEGNLAHWTQGLTTAFMEGLNSLFSAVKRKACRDRSVEYITTLYFVAAKLPVSLVSGFFDNNVGRIAIRPFFLVSEDLCCEGQGDRNRVGSRFKNSDEIRNRGQAHWF